MLFYKKNYIPLRSDFLRNWVDFIYKTLEITSDINYANDSAVSKKRKNSA